MIKLCAKNGAMMRRVKRGKIGQAKLIFLVNENKQLRYHTLGYSRIISSKQKTVKIDQLIEIRHGFGTDQLQKAAKKISFQQIAPEENCVSLIVRQNGKNKQKTIDFIAATLSDKRIFVDALQYIIDKEDAKLIDFNEKQWIIDKFHALDTNQTGMIVR
ncbi:Uncharacterized protein BM_BM17331 [Brugia malayi]|uniref:Uncharacterized protein n=1 Tax=Brugia malayi TaxID=6279 RepID=A0A4E9F2H4_BRUMA|nr:Uncharacterized protein BM_BM17331 [Brugia malayi]VIO90269.1 Uncharacterized protein BM_BM17331 [Brugia malayi]